MLITASHMSPNLGKLSQTLILTPIFFKGAGKGDLKKYQWSLGREREKENRSLIVPQVAWGRQGNGVTHSEISWWLVWFTEERSLVSLQVLKMLKTIPKVSHLVPDLSEPLPQSQWLLIPWQCKSWLLWWTVFLACLLMELLCPNQCLAYRRCCTNSF